MLLSSAHAHAESNILETNTDSLEKNPNKILWLNTRKQDHESCKRQRCSLHPLTRFSSIEDCERYAQQNLNSQVSLIVDGQITPEVLTKLNGLQTIRSIYLCSSDDYKNTSWFPELKKVRRIAVSTDIDELIQRINSDERKRICTTESLAFNIIDTSGSDEEEMTSTEINGEFLHSQLLLDCLLTMEATNHEKTTAIAYFRKEYHSNASELRKLDEFELNYSNQQAVRWYTQDSFVYRVLNKAFRIQDIDKLFLMRFIIRDLYQQLQVQQKDVPISATHVYRTQLISKTELDGFEINRLISVNSFYSTTLDRAYALFLLPDQSTYEDVASVLFEIDISLREPSAKPFADITNMSAFPDETEVLFMAGSIFRVVNIQLNVTGINVIQLVLCGDDDHNLKLLFEHMRQDIPAECSQLTYGIVLANASKLKQAEQFFNNMLNELSADDPLVTHCYHQLGNVLDDEGEFEKSLEYFEKALARKLSAPLENDTGLANTYTCCGVGYLRKSELDRALEFYQKALEIYRNVHGNDSSDVAMCLLNIGDVKQCQKKPDEALDLSKQALEIWMKCLPENHPDLARAHIAIADVQVELLQAEEALNHYNDALTIMRDSLPHDHHELAGLYDKLGNLYYSVGDNGNAQEYLNLGLSIKQKLYPPDHSSMVDSYHGLGLIYKDAGDYHQAVSLLEQALAIHSQILPPDHESTIQMRQDLTAAREYLL